ncbi:glycine zipper domain-containing protein [Hymenobacter bucti]|uniref:Glycine zipper domain-containing protein n=1 Tax=Hymenobacter bucti TaxID=1844114 RepID=A0ABW4QQE6_9BACT
MKRTSWLFLLPVLLFSFLSSHQAQAQRGWSPQGKGAAIGGAAGILGGALINKRNRVVGGAIGGAAGAGIGYGVGKHIDNKRKKAAALAAERAAANQRIAAANARAASAERAAAERRVVVERQAVARPAMGVATAATAAGAGLVAAQAFAPSTPPNTVIAAGYLPNPQYGQTGTAYPSSPILRKSW